MQDAALGLSFPPMKECIPARGFVDRLKFDNMVLSFACTALAVYFKGAIKTTGEIAEGEGDWKRCDHVF